MGFLPNTQGARKQIILRDEGGVRAGWHRRRDVAANSTTTSHAAAVGRSQSSESFNSINCKGPPNNVSMNVL